jgi:hypothetical protein
MIVDAEAVLASTLVVSSGCEEPCALASESTPAPARTTLMVEIRCIVGRAVKR